MLEFEKVKILNRFYFGFTSQGASYFFALGRQYHRAEMYFMSDEDKQKFDAMYKYKDEIEQKIPNLVWQRLDGKKASRIKLELTEAEKSMFRGKWGEEAYSEDLINWLADSMIKLLPVMSYYWDKVRS